MLNSCALGAVIYVMQNSGGILPLSTAICSPARVRTIIFLIGNISRPMTPAHRLSSSPDSSPNLAYCKDGVHHGGAAKQVDKRYERLAVSLVRFGLQCRFTVILHGTFISMFKTCETDPPRRLGCRSSHWFSSPSGIRAYCLSGVGSLSWEQLRRYCLKTDPDISQQERSSNTQQTNRMTAWSLHIR